MKKVVHKCCFPGCEYETENRSKIDFHHVIPKEIKKTKITIPLCKNHHSLIYHPDSKAGQHSIKTEKSLEIINLFQSNFGISIKYKRNDGSQFFYIPFDGSIIED